VAGGRLHGRQITAGPAMAGITIAVQVLTGSYGMPRPGIRHAAAARASMRASYTVGHQ